MTKPEARIASLLQELSVYLTEADVEQIRELLQAGEPGIALENLCTQLYEHDGECSSQQYDEIERIGRSMGISPNRWEFLKSP